MRWLVFSTVAIASLLATPALSRMPSPETSGAIFNMLDYYPKEALRLGIEGDVELACSVRADGTLTGCQVTKESPPEQGFGEAALQMSTRFKMRPKTVNGEPVAGGQVRIPLKFKAP